MMTSGELALHNQLQVIKLEIERLKRQQRHEALVNENLRCRTTKLTEQMNRVSDIATTAAKKVLEFDERVLPVLQAAKETLENQTD